MFTKRESDILNLLVQGKTNQEIGDILSISTHTVKAHLSLIYSKLNVKSRVLAVVKYLQIKKDDETNELIKRKTNCA